MFVLDAQREGDVVAAFARYRAYLEQHHERFPPSAYSLATSEWYFDPRDHRCPHDSWLESFTLGEPSSGTRSEVRSTALSIKLLGAFHDGWIELTYPHVFDYTLSASVGSGHGEWRYDQFTLDEAGRLVHEIEWRSAKSDHLWRIVASDIHFTWAPRV